MSPKRGTGCSGSVGGRELQALLDSAVVPIADKDDAAGQIPWRTSRRLQAATLRSLVKEREIDIFVPVTKEKAFPEALSMRCLKRQRSPSSPTTPLDLCQTEDTDDIEVNGDSSVDEDCARKGIIECGELAPRGTKKRTVHFANPLVYYIEDKLEEESDSAPVTEKKAVRKGENEARGTAKRSFGTSKPQKVPMSCFDLLCNYSGAKGWKCYRTRIDGESYCNFHLVSRKAASPSIVRISVCS